LRQVEEGKKEIDRKINSPVSLKADSTYEAEKHFHCEWKRDNKARGAGA